MCYPSKAPDAATPPKYILLILAAILALCTGALSWYATSHDHPLALHRHEERPIRLFGLTGAFTVDCDCPPYLIAETARKFPVDFAVTLEYPLAGGANKLLKSNESVEVLATARAADILNHYGGKYHEDADPYTRMDNGDLAHVLASHQEVSLSNSSVMELTAHSSEFSGVMFTLSDYLESENGSEGGVVETAAHIQLSMTVRPSLTHDLRPILYACPVLALTLAFLYLTDRKLRFRKGQEKQLLSPAKAKADRDVFISYKMEDVKAAERVRAALESQSISCWIAPRDIEPGQVWATAIVEGLDRSKTFVLLLSPHSSEAKQISREAELADRQNIPIIIFRLEDVHPSKELLYFLGNLQWLDAFGGRFDSAVDRLAGTIRSSASRTASRK